MTYRARFSLGGFLGLLCVLVLVGLDVWLAGWVVDRAVRQQAINFGTYLVGLVVLATLPVLAVLAYHTWSWLTLRYHLDRNGLSIRWAGSEERIPIREIQRIVPGSQLAASRTAADGQSPGALSRVYDALVARVRSLRSETWQSVLSEPRRLLQIIGGNRWKQGEVGRRDIVRRRGIRWPGHERGAGLIPGIGRTRFFATRPLAEQLLVIVPGAAFAISPRDLGEFVRSFEARRELGPNRIEERELRHAPWFAWSLWRDRMAWILLGAAVFVNVSLFGYLSARFPGLDFQLPLHFNNVGQVDRIAAKIELFALPIIGLIILGTNLVLGLLLYRRERAGSYLLWGSSAVVQGLFWLATFSLVP